MDDFISRQAALDFKVSQGLNVGGILYVPYAEIKKYLGQLPTAERKGHWIEEDDGIIHGRCSCCGWVSVWQSNDVFGMDYCPNCGARLEDGT